MLASFAYCLYVKADEGYGLKDATTKFTEAEKALIDLAKLDENDPRQHKGKCMISFGQNMGFWGNSEHVNLDFNQLDNGFFS